MDIDPYHVNAAYAWGACENKRSNFAKAIEDYNMALSIDQGRLKVNQPSIWKYVGDWLSIPQSNQDEEFMRGSIVFKDREILK